MPIGYPSPQSNYIPNHAASNSLVVGFSRNPNTFRLPEYTQYIKAGNMQFFYYVWASRQGARIISNQDFEHDWPDGAPAPTEPNNLEGGYWQSGLTKRKAYAFTMGRLTVEQATFPILAAESGVMAQQAMTARTLLTYNAISTASWGSNTIPVDGAYAGGLLPAGQNWKTGSVGYSGNQGPNIKITLQYASRLVHQQTIGVVQPSMLTLVVNPTTAQGMAASTEIQDYIKQSQFALAQLRGDVPNQNGKWDLPTMIYGHPVAVEDTVRVTTRKSINNPTQVDTLSYVVPDGTAFLLARQGELEGVEGSRSYSTVQIFFYNDELTVYSKYDADDERYIGRVVSNFVPIAVTNYAGFYLTSCLG